MGRKPENIYLLIHTETAEDFQDLCRLLAFVEKLKKLARPKYRHQAEYLHDEILIQARNMITANGRSPKNHPPRVDQ